MKYYSKFTEYYVQEICNALNRAGYVMNKMDNKPFVPESFKTLTEFFQNYVIDAPDIYEFLNQKGLINRGICPFTGQHINSNKFNWSFHNRIVYLSQEGSQIMQDEDNASFEELFGKPAHIVTQPPKRIELKNTYKQVDISEKSDELIKKSITCLKIGFSFILFFSALSMISGFVSISKANAGASGIVALILMSLFFVFLLIKMYAYSDVYKIFRETQTQKALEDVLDAQKGFYWWIFVLPLIFFGLAFGLAFLAFIIGDFLFK